MFWITISLIVIVMVVVTPWVVKRHKERKKEVVEYALASEVEKLDKRVTALEETSQRASMDKLRIQLAGVDIEEKEKILTVEDVESVIEDPELEQWNEYLKNLSPEDFKKPGDVEYVEGRLSSGKSVLVIKIPEKLTTDKNTKTNQEEKDRKKGEKYD